jgi:hypothetical protein
MMMLKEWLPLQRSCSNLLLCKRLPLLRSQFQSSLLLLLLTPKWCSICCCSTHVLLNQHLLLLCSNGGLCTGRGALCDGRVMDNSTIDLATLGAAGTQLPHEWLNGQCHMHTST